MTRRVLVKMARTGTRDVGDCGASGTAAGGGCSAARTGPAAPWLPPDTCTRRGSRGARAGGGPMAVGVAGKTDGERTRRPPYPFPPNPALGLGMRGERPRQRTAPPGCTGGDAAPIRGSCPRRKPARAYWCASGISPWKCYQENVPAHIPQGGVLSEPRSWLEAVRWEKIPGGSCSAFVMQGMC